MGSSHSKPSNPTARNPPVFERPPSDPTKSYTWQSYHYYDIPRVDMPMQKNGKIVDQGRSHFPKKLAQEIALKQPPPVPNIAGNRRPHPHYDLQNQFVEERRHLTPIPTQVPHRRHGAPVLYSYMTDAEWDYEHQNRNGRVPLNEHNTAFRDEGCHRIITDRHQNVQGMVTHWPRRPEGSKNFIRAESKVEYIKVPRKRD